MKLTDIIALAKAGYRKDDIDVMLQVPVDEPEPLMPSPDSTEPENGSKGDPEPSPEPSSNEPDYEQLYKEVLGQIDTLKNDLKIAQETIRKQNNQPAQPDPLDDLADVFRSYM